MFSTGQASIMKHLPLWQAFCRQGSPSCKQTTAVKQLVSLIALINFFIVR